MKLKDLARLIDKAKPNLAVVETPEYLALTNLVTLLENSGDHKIESLKQAKITIKAAARSAPAPLPPPDTVVLEMYARLQEVRGNWPSSQALLKEARAMTAPQVHALAKLCYLPKSKSKAEALRELDARFLVFAQDAATISAVHAAE